MTDPDRESYEAARRLLKKRNYREAFVAYEALARAGDPRCQVFLGWMHHEGLGTAKDPNQALVWFSSAANLGSSEAAFYCGKTELSRRNYDRALDWFRKGGANQYGPALLWLGLVHIRGLGTKIDLDKGIRYLKEAASTGNFPAKRELAVLMMKGKLGASRVLPGVILFAGAVFSALVSAVLDGQSDKLMG